MLDVDVALWVRGGTHRNFKGIINEQLDHWAERAVLQGDQSTRRAPIAGLTANARAMSIRRFQTFWRTARRSRSVVGRSAPIPFSRWRIDPIRPSIRRSFLFCCHSMTDLRAVRTVVKKIRDAARATAAILAKPSAILRMELYSVFLFCCSVVLFPTNARTHHRLR